jgi:hypothetical protein
MLGNSIGRFYGLCLSRSAVKAASLLATLLMSAALYAQITGTLTGTVYDQTGALVPRAKVILLDQKTNDRRETESNGVGYFSFVSVGPSVYTVTVEAAGFKSWKRAEITMNAGDLRTISDVKLEIGKTDEFITVEATPDEVKAVDSGERSAVLTSKDFDRITLESRNASVLMKILPGVSVAPNMGGGSGIEWMNTIGAQGSLAGNGLNANGTPNRGGTSIMNDGANIIDPGCNCWGIQTVDADMTQEVKVQTSNFGADSSHGPVVINTIGKAGGASYHGEGYLHLRNDALNANSWENNHAGIAQGSGHYYYPGGSFGGPVPFTHKKVLFWAGYEHFYQNLGSTNTLQSDIPTAAMLAGDFSAGGSGNSTLCPSGPSSAPGSWCTDLSTGSTFAPNGTLVTSNNIASFIDPGALAMTKFWPTPNVDPAQNGGFNYIKAIPSLHNGYILRFRFDYNLNENNKIFVSYQKASDGQIEQNTGAHMWWQPANAIQFPGGGLQNPSVGKTLTVHFLHVFSPSLTNEAIASWGFGSSPILSSNLKAAFRDTLGYPSYGTVYNVGVKMIPSYDSPTQLSFPDFDQADVFENGTGTFPNRKEMPSLTDNLTKVWRNHTIKIGGFYERTGDYQASWVYPNGKFQYGQGQFADIITGQTIGSSNPLAAFLMGEAGGGGSSGYQENNLSQITDMAYHTISAYVDDSWKISRRVSLQLGLRIEHIQHWYDRRGNGMAVWMPERLQADLLSGKLFPGVYWHGIDHSIDNTGSPNRFAFYSPRFGIAYDIFGTGKTVLRGGWGAYRWNDQYNDPAGALTVAQGLQTYNLPNNRMVTLGEVGQLVPPAATWSPGSVNVLDPHDDEIPVTYSYNFTISQELPGKSLLEVAYVGNNSGNLNMGGGSGSAQGGNFPNQNKVALGALFNADPITGALPDPEHADIGDYSPYGYVNIPSAPTTLCDSSRSTIGVNCWVPAYTNNAITMPTHVGYANYNALQVSWLKRTGRLNFNLNYTHSKALAGNLAIDAFTVHGNYGVVGTDRPNVFNASYAIDLWSPYRGNFKLLRGVSEGWTLAGLTTWQAGGNVQALYSSNLNLNLSDASGSNISSQSYFGTNAQTVMPTLTCDPTAGLASNQRAKLSCFGAPALVPLQMNANGPRQLGYISGPVYWDSDLAVYKTFHVTERQSVEFRLSAFNFLNHPLPGFQGDQMKLYFQQTAGGSFSPTSNISSTFGQLNTKDGQRTVEVALKYVF